jgi:hypothetical protein
LPIDSVFELFKWLLSATLPLILFLFGRQMLKRTDEKNGKNSHDIVDMKVELKLKDQRIRELEIKIAVLEERLKGLQ